jgi:Tfp pilus assembly protein PilN
VNPLQSLFALRVNWSAPTGNLAVNVLEAVWLNSMKDQGTSVDIDGMALSTDAVASLISNLQKTGHFKNIEIKETFQDDTYKEMQAFNFTLTCEKAKS